MFSLFEKYPQFGHIIKALYYILLIQFCQSKNNTNNQVEMTDTHIIWRWKAPVIFSKNNLQRTKYKADLFSLLYKYGGQL